MSSEYLKVIFLDGLHEEINHYNKRITPFIAENSKIYFNPIKDSQKLTIHKDVKTVYKISFDLTNNNHEFLPGDTIGILPTNNRSLINNILLKLNLLEVADKLCELQISKETKKKNPTIPKHLPTRSTIRNIFLNHIDVQTPPKKLFLKSIAKYVQDSDERIKIEHLCNTKFTRDYTDFISTTGRTLLSLLESFPSCQPPVELIFEHLPPLLPRPYSISSSPLSNRLEITFFVLFHNDGSKGLCTGWLEDLILEKSEVLIPWYFRQSSKFRFPQELSYPVILIGTGTGIAPFRGFLQHLKIQGSTNNKVWLLYGCRFRDKDFLFKDEIEEYFDMKIITKLDVCFSRESEEKCYVQHKIEENRDEFMEWVLKEDARVFLCGDFKTVVKSVRNSIGEICQEMERNSRFIVDSWI